MSIVQDNLTAATSYKNHSPTKEASKKRGRACTRRERRVNCMDTRIVRDALAASFARREFQKAANAEKDSSTTSAAVLELRAVAKMHQANFETGVLVRDVMNKYPPLT